VIDYVPYGIFVGMLILVWYAYKWETGISMLEQFRRLLDEHEEE
jgi:hypothetical protein